MLFPRYHVILTSNPSKFTQFDPLTSTESVMKDYQFSRMQKSKGFPAGYLPHHLIWQITETEETQVP